MKRTYRVNEIARKLRKTQGTVLEWSKQFANFLPTIAVGGTLRYTEEAIEVLRMISKMKDANKSSKFITENLQEMRQKVIHTPNGQEKLVFPEPAVVPENVPEWNVQNIPLIENKANPLLSNETKELLNMVLSITQKLEANKSPSRINEQVEDRNEIVGISSISSGSQVSQKRSHVYDLFDQLTNEVTELRGIILSLMEKVIDVSKDAESS